jgi:H+-transporting ATPase
MASRGIAMASLPVLVLLGTFAGAVALAFIVDVVKIPIFNRLKIA